MHLGHRIQVQDTGTVKADFLLRTSAYSAKRIGNGLPALLDHPRVTRRRPSISITDFVFSPNIVSVTRAVISITGIRSHPVGSHSDTLLDLLEPSSKPQTSIVRTPYPTVNVPCYVRLS